MRNIIVWIWITLLFLFAVGCSQGKEPANDASPASIFSGTIVEKRDGAVLVVAGVTDEEIKSLTVEQLLQEKSPEAIWVSYPDSDSFSIGQRVHVELEGPIAESYPAQAKASKITVQTE